LNFFEHPIINNPYDYPARHWELDGSGRPTNVILDHRRQCRFVSPVPPPKGSRKKFGKDQGSLDLAFGDSPADEYDPTSIINEIRGHVGDWRRLPSRQWGVTPHTARLLQHWRQGPFNDIRPFFCQVEAVETAIWLAEVALPRRNRGSLRIRTHLDSVNEMANPLLQRVALKLATGAGKTTVMAMLIAWQTINAVRLRDSQRFAHGFLIVTPGITIKDRLRVLLPNDPDNYYREREIVPPDMLAEIQHAKVVITNYHAFKRRERTSLSKTSRAFLRGRGPELNTLETDGQILQRIMPELMNLKSLVVINDEAHHCYRERPAKEDLKGDDKAEAQRNNEAARLWITGVETVKRHLKLRQMTVYDLSATPFFLKGSGYREGALFPWTVSDFSLMDAIECGIVKLPRVPVSDGTAAEMPVYRDLWSHIGKDMPKKGRGKAGNVSPLDLPPKLNTAIDLLYGHYRGEFERWRDTNQEVEPVFIVVCNNTSASKLVHDYISGFHAETDDGRTYFQQGRLELFRNYDDYGERLAKPRTLLIDSEQLESGEALDKSFREMAADELEAFRRELNERFGAGSGDRLTDQAILREVMNTVGKPGRLGAGIRCVVSVSMLTEGWDANTVTHILGVRAFGSQLLCEQVVGRGLRRKSYVLNDQKLFNVEYADVFGIPFDFTDNQPPPPPAPPPPPMTRIFAIAPERDDLEIRFPRVTGYRRELPTTRLAARFDERSRMRLTQEKVGPCENDNLGIFGEGVTMTLDYLKSLRPSSVVYHLTQFLLFRHFRGAGEEPKMHLFGPLKRIVRQWLDGYLECVGKTFPGQLAYQQLAAEACERIVAAITYPDGTPPPVRAILDPYNATGSTSHVRFNTAKTTLWDTSGPPPKCHVNFVVQDSNWEARFCRAAEAEPRVLAYVKNHALGFEIPYRHQDQARVYRPDFILRIATGTAEPLHLIVEITGFPQDDKAAKIEAIETFWVPGVNSLGRYGHWAFAEFTDGGDLSRHLAETIDALSTHQPAA
jgi:type III restriction enzyme